MVAPAGAQIVKIGNCDCRDMTYKQVRGLTKNRSIENKINFDKP